MTDQRHLFNLPEEVRYLNCAYMGPWTREASQIIQEETLRRQRPFLFTTKDFFEHVDRLKRSFARLVDCDDPLRIVPLGSVSYGMAQIGRNLNLSKGQKIIMVEDEFPSGVYMAKALSRRTGASLHVIRRPHPISDWNVAILNEIDDRVGLVLMSQVHWADGFLFDLEQITNKTHHHGGYVVVDATQTIGALPFSLQQIPVDALLTATYKWLLGPYGFSLGYYGPAFDTGTPIEESWMNRLESDQFHKLTDYQSVYRPGAWRYSVGEQSNLLAVNLANASLTYIHSLTPEAIQLHTKSIAEKTLHRLATHGFKVHDPGLRGHHLFGIYCPPELNQLALQQKLEREKIFVSLRGDSIRVSPHVYNTEEDMEALASALINSL